MKKILSLILVFTMILGFAACGTGTDEKKQTSENVQENSDTAVSESSEKADIEKALNLSNIKPEWTCSDSGDAWTMAVVTSVTKAELPDYQGVSVCVPGAYVKGIDTDGDGTADVTSGTASGILILDRDAEVTSTNGQTYTAQTAPVIINTGAAGYGSQSNQTAGSTYAKEGYINVTCGNRGKQSTLSDGTYTGDAPSCLTDQKNAVRFVKYNILLGNLPGSTERFISTGGSGGGAHAVMLAATSKHPDFYDYQIAQGAVGVYRNSDGTYSTAVTIDGKETELSDGLWGCMAYSAITSLAEADMALAFEYYLNNAYNFNTDFQKKTAEYLAAEYKDYINGKQLSVEEAKAGLDLNGDGDQSGTVPLTIEYDENGHADTNGYYGTYLDLYLAEFEQSLQAYINRLAYAEDWTWFGSDEKALSDGEVAAMTDDDRAEAFINGRYVKGSMGNSGGMEGGLGGAPGGNPPSGDAPNGNPPSGSPPDGTPPTGDNAGSPPDMNGEKSEEVGTPDAGTTQASGSRTNSSNYSDFNEMLTAYQSDIAEIQAGDAYGKNIVDLYDPTRYIRANGTNNPTWARILMGASEGDISMLNSLNLRIAWLNAGMDAEIEWQWDGGHVPSEIFGDSLALYVDMMVGKYANGSTITKAAATGQSSNGSGTEPSGTDLSSWVTYDRDKGIEMTLPGIAAYRTSRASKATPGFDVIDYGQEDYVFGSGTQDARHWSKYVLKVFEEHADVLAELFR